MSHTNAKLGVLRTAYALVFLTAAAVLIACGGGSNNSNSGGSAMPSNQEIFGFIEDITGFGPRRTGTEAGVKTADYVAAKFRSFGLQNVSIQKGDSLQWDAKAWGLVVNGTEIPSFYMRHSFSSGDEGAFSTGPGGLQAQFVYVGNRKDLRGIDVQGKIVVADVELTQSDMDMYMAAAALVHDPEKTISSEPRLDPFTPNNFPFNFASAMEGGAVGFVGILSNYFDSNKFYNEDLSYYVGRDFHLEIPGLWVSRQDGEKLKTLLAQNPQAGGRMVLEGDVKKVQYNVVVGHLKGKSPETLMVQSHHDSGFMGAVEDASGVAEVLALAKYYGQHPESRRERSMMFVTMDTHFTGYEAHGDFARNYIRKGGIDVVANVTVEHIAREMTIKDGKQVMTGQVEPRIFITSPSLIGIASQHVKQNDFRRSLVLPTALFAHSAGIPTDVGPIHAALGFPVISLISAPGYLYDISDTLDKVAKDQLEPTATLVAAMLDTISQTPRDKLVPDR